MAVDVPVIASLNGTTAGGWTGYARMIADAAISGRRIEDELVELIAAVRTAVDVPLAVKLGPYYSSLAHLAPRLVDAGADGLVLFNRFYQPDIDLETLDVTPHLVLSSSEELRLPLRWMLEREYVSVEQLKGSVSQQAVADPAAFERANYIRTLTRYSSTFRA